MDAAWSEWLQGMIVTVIETQGHLTVTELRGQLPDQAALMGVLEHLHDCAIPMISIVNMSIDPYCHKQEYG